MIKIEEGFKKDGKAFVAFITAGDPTLEATERYLKVLQDGGADIIEVGIPFSDPIAEGVVIQEADIRALKHNVTVDNIFAMLEKVEKRVPFLFMTYANPVFFYGYDKFFARCQKAGIAGVIIPDIPFKESGEVKAVAAKYGIVVTDMVAPTSGERVKNTCKDAQGFIYLVSSMGVTGVRDKIVTDIGAIVRTIKEVTATPVCVGFGISTTEQAKDTAAVADGVIVGSAIVRIIAEYGEKAEEELYRYIRAMATSVHGV